MKNYPPFYDDIKNSDPELYDLITNTYDLVMKPGAIDIKTKMLILLAVDAFAGSSGVKAISEIAKKTGAGNNEIIEAIRIAYSVAGNRVLHTSAIVFSEM
ncbi:MAG: carboxymuconolactone decarboxylase family protein [Chlorobi bacterium]|nr:carboxymuconolactone decarboxylase family protein [Chlorobiota bacterium]